MKRALILFLSLTFLCTACTSTQTLEIVNNPEKENKTEIVNNPEKENKTEIVNNPRKENKLDKVKETDKFVYFCTDQDSKTVDEIDKVLEERYPEICRDLEYDYAYKIPVEIYPDQSSYDNNPSRIGDAGFPAVSADRKIQMVSPKSPVKVPGITYKERLLMTVHEFAHLMVNEINQDAPMWLQEGVASYEGSKEGYEKIIFDNIDKVPQFSFSKLENSYYDLGYADVYSYFSVKYIVENFGYGKLSNILRKPGNLEDILQLKKAKFDKALNSYIQSRSQMAEKSQSAKVACVPFELYFNETFFQASIDNSGPLWFILDTGCSESTINEKTVKKLGLRTGPKIDKGYVGVGGESVQEASIDTVCLNIQGTDIQFDKGFVTGTMDILEAVFGRHVDGMLGCQLLERYVVEIDPQAKMFTLFDPGEYEYNGSGSIIPLSIDGVPYLKATIELPDSRTIEGTFMADNGCTAAMNIAGPFSTKYDLHNIIKNTIPSIGAGAGGNSETRIGRINSLKIDKYEISKPLANIYSDKNGGMSRSDISGYIGNETFKRFKVIFDYSRNRMILEPQASLKDPFESDMSGLFLYTAGENFKQITVFGTIPGSPADQAGIKAGDIIDSVDGVKTDAYSIDDLGNMFKCDGKQYRLGIKRNEEIFEVGIKLKRLV